MTFKKPLIILHSEGTIGIKEILTAEHSLWCAIQHQLEATDNSQ